MTQIPRIIHQTWKDNDVPPILSWLASTWKEKHPDWEYKLWTDEMNRNFIKYQHPDFLRIYDSYSYNIQRVDAVRYFVLLTTGGVFIDFDFECVRNIEPLLKKKSIFGIEPDVHCPPFGKEMIICNAFMACEPNNDFMKVVCSDLCNNEMPPNYDNMSPHLKILESTGPFKLTNVYNRYRKKEEIEIMPSSFVYPLNMNETREIMINKKVTNPLIQAKIDNAYAVHYFMGSWH